MTEYAWPTVLRPSRLSFYLQHNTLRFASPITRVTQVMRREGARWMAEATFDPLDRVRAGVLEGLLAALAGSVNTVRIWDWRREYRTGDPRSQGDVPTGPYSFSDATIFTDGTGMVVGSGNPSLAAGAARGALSIQTAGWWPNTTAVGAGDYFGLNGRLYMATAAITASGTGGYNNHNRHVFDGPNFELRQLDPNVAIPFLNETDGTAIIGRALRMEACSPIVARHTGSATDCEYEVAWANTYAVRMDYASTADRAGNAVINRHRAPASRLLRMLEAVPNLRAAAFRQSATEIGVERLATLATSTTAATTLAGLCFNGLDGIAATARGLLLDANRGLAFVVDTSSAKEFALAHWLVGGADGGRLFVRVFDGAANVRENIAGDVLASGTTMQWNSPAKGWNAGAVMADASLNRRQTIRVGAGVAFAQVGIVGFDGQIELEALRLFGLPEAAPAVLYACPSVPIGTRSLALETTWDLPSLTAGATANIDVTVPGARRGDFADASLDTSSIAFVLDCHVWSNNSVRVTARNVSASTVDLAAAPLSVGVTKRRMP